MFIKESNNHGFQCAILFLCIDAFSAELQPIYSVMVVKVCFFVTIAWACAVLWSSSLETHWLMPN